MKCKKCNRDVSSSSLVRLDIGVRVVPSDTDKPIEAYVATIEYCIPCSKNEVTKFKLEHKLKQVGT